MRITRKMLEKRVSLLNENIFKMGLSVRYSNGCTLIYYFGKLISVGTTSECYYELSIFISGYYAGCLANSEVK